MSTNQIKNKKTYSCLSMHMYRSLFYCDVVLSEIIPIKESRFSSLIVLLPLHNTVFFRNANLLKQKREWISIGPFLRSSCWPRSMCYTRVPEVFNLSNKHATTDGQCRVHRPLVKLKLYEAHTFQG